jgi:hypothetical protein
MQTRFRQCTLQTDYFARQLALLTLAQGPLQLPTALQVH